MTDTRFGLTPEEWDAAKEETRDILVGVAMDRGFIPYSDLVNRLETVKLEPNSYALAHLLGEIPTEEDNAGRGMLSVIVTHRDGDMQPGPGFFELAGELGRDTSGQDAFWVEEYNRVLSYWGARPKGSG